MYPEIPVIELSDLGIDVNRPFSTMGHRKDIYLTYNRENLQPSIVKIYKERQRVSRYRWKHVSLEARGQQAIEEAEDYLLCSQDPALGALTVPIFHLVAQKGAIIGTHIAAFNSSVLEDSFGQKPLVPNEFYDFRHRLVEAYTQRGLMLHPNSYHSTQLLFNVDMPFPTADQTRIRFGDCVVIKSCRFPSKKARVDSGRVHYEHSITEAFEYINKNFVDYTWRAF